MPVAAAQVCTAAAAADMDSVRRGPAACRVPSELVRSLLSVAQSLLCAMLRSMEHCLVTPHQHIYACTATAPSTACFECCAGMCCMPD